MKKLACIILIITMSVMLLPAEESCKDVSSINWDWSEMLNGSFICFEDIDKVYKESLAACFDLDDSPEVDALIEKIETEYSFMAECQQLYNYCMHIDSKDYSADQFADRISYANQRYMNYEYILVSMNIKHQLFKGMMSAINERLSVLKSDFIAVLSCELNELEKDEEHYGDYVIYCNERLNNIIQRCNFPREEVMDFISHYNDVLNSNMLIIAKKDMKNRIEVFNGQAALRLSRIKYTIYHLDSKKIPYYEKENAIKDLITLDSEGLSSELRILYDDLHDRARMWEDYSLTYNKASTMERLTLRNVL